MKIDFEDQGYYVIAALRIPFYRLVARTPKRADALHELRTLWAQIVIEVQAAFAEAEKVAK